MPKKGKNKAQRVGPMSQEQEWFKAKKKQDAKRKRLAKASKKRNRKR